MEMQRLEYESKLSKRKDVSTSLQNERQHRVGECELKQKKEHIISGLVSQYIQKARAGQMKMTVKGKSDHKCSADSVLKENIAPTTNRPSRQKLFKVCDPSKRS